MRGKYPRQRVDGGVPRIGMKLEDFGPVWIPNALFMRFVGENGECISVRVEHYVKFLNKILRGKTLFYRFKLGEHNDEAEFVKAERPAHTHRIDIELSNGEKHGIRDGNGELFIVTDTEKFIIKSAADYINECLNRTK